MRAKKDERIHDMAMEQKKKMEEAKKSGQRFKAFFVSKYLYFSGIPNYSGSTGGFVGIDRLTSRGTF